MFGELIVLPVKNGLKVREMYDDDNDDRLHAGSQNVPDDAT